MFSKQTQDLLLIGALGMGVWILYKMRKANQEQPASQTSGVTQPYSGYLIGRNGERIPLPAPNIPEGAITVRM